MKDPSVVFHDRRWLIFATTASSKGWGMAYFNPARAPQTFARSSGPIRKVSRPLMAIPAANSRLSRAKRKPSMGGERDPALDGRYFNFADATGISVSTAV